MKRSLLLAPISAALLALAGCATSGTPAGDVAALAAYMTGTFESDAPPGAQPEDRRAVRIVVLPIWQERDDGPWLYVERAAVATPDQPYLQRVRRLSIDGLEGLRSDVHGLPEDPRDFAAAWTDPGVFATIEPADLYPLEGCAVFLRRRADGSFVGESRGTACRSRRDGAAYATSQFEITSDGFTLLERGFTSRHALVWGSESGPTRFRKVSPRSP